MTERAAVSRWLFGYEAAWRAPGTEGLAHLFTEGATYLQSPYEEPVAGLDAISRMGEQRAAPADVRGRFRGNVPQAVFLIFQDKALNAAFKSQPFAVCTATGAVVMVGRIHHS